MPSRRNIKLVLEYDGTNYCGWQRQAEGRRTVQQTVEDRLAMITQQKTTLIGAGRTDAGVHALGQAANFKTASRLTPADFKRALNGLLPPDIVVREAEEVHSGFHARFHARSKRYEYFILNRELPSAVGRLYHWHVQVRLAAAPMRKAMHMLLGQHDFSSFQSTGSPVASPVRVMTGCGLRREGDIIRLWFEANGFLRKMVRSAVGTLVEVGLGKLTTQGFSEILSARDRGKAAATAPPNGLFLVEVRY
jgi:tRNA pseudouridine38-40 synthase